MQDGLSAESLGVVLAAGTTIRLVAGPYGGRLADRPGRAPLVFAGCAAASAVIAVGYAGARGFPLLLVISVMHAAVLAPLTPIADALALGSAAQKRGFDYGWVRAAGSAAFIAGTLVAGQVVGRSGLGVIVWLNAALLAATAGLGWFLPNRVAGATRPHGAPVASRAIQTLLANPVYRRLMLLAALIGGSHALHDGFEVIRWRAAGLSTGQTSLLWSLSVVGEVVVFAYIGRRLLNRVGAAWAVALSAAAGVVRWSAAALTAWFPAMVLVEPLHGLTFALLHLACMDVIERAVPGELAVTAQAFYATVAMGAAAAALTLAAGSLYGHFGAGAFWFMAACCALALPLTPGIRSTGPR